MTAYNSTYTYANSPYLLPNWQASGQWCDTDTEHLYNINCEQRPPGWTWENRTVRYTWNKDGYRCQEWGLVDWPATHVIMGCSHVLGVGVDDADTLSHQLSTQLAEPVLNLGIGGASAHTIQYNTLRLIELGWRPKTVTISIPQPERLTYFDNHAIQHFTPSVLPPGEPTGILKFYEQWLRPPHHAELYSRLAIKGAEALWLAQGVPVIMRHASTITEPQQMAPMWAQYVDYARDLQHNGANEYYGHPGPATLALWARDLADAVRLL